MNKCIGDDMKAAAHRSLNCIKKTKKCVLWNAGISPIAEILCFPMQDFTEIGQSAAELWLKTVFNIAAVRHLEF